MERVLVVQLICELEYRLLDVLLELLWSDLRVSIGRHPE